jgi:MoaA/NifB/PqqE/SkfB family radical SAM enzyme
MPVKYDVEANWLLLQPCNFRCDYCHQSEAALGAKAKIFGSIAQWRDGFKATGKTWLIHITGGEPTIYPDFVELCDELCQNHFLSINSNLAHRRILTFAKKIPPERIRFINASIHFKERQKHNSLDVFIERAQVLMDAKFTVLPSLVMTPEMVSNAHAIYEQLEALGLFAIPKVLRGIYAGKHYPLEYSAEEKRIITEYIIRARQSYDDLLTSMEEPPTIDMFSDDRFLRSLEDYRGRLCGGGYKFVKITPDGTVCRCNSRDNLGNVLSRNVKLLNAPKVCDTYFCPYFCEKYSVQPVGSYSRFKVKLLKKFVTMKLICLGWLTASMTFGSCLEMLY